MNDLNVVSLKSVELAGQLSRILRSLGVCCILSGREVLFPPLYQGVVGAVTLTLARPAQV